MYPHESEITAALHLANLLAVAPKRQVLRLSLVVCCLPWPWKGFSPCLITQPVANEVGISLSQISITRSRYGKERWLWTGSLQRRRGLGSSP